VSVMTKTQVSRPKAGKSKAWKGQARPRARRAASQIAPYATKGRKAAGQRLLTARAWAAPRIERSGQVFQQRVAPRMSAMLTAAARRIEPARPKRRRWPLLAAGLLTVAAGATAAVALSRRGSGLGQLGKPGSTGHSDTPAAPAASDANGRVRTP
jgi:hypothetical protein